MLGARKIVTQTTINATPIEDLIHRSENLLEQKNSRYTQLTRAIDFKENNIQKPPNVR